MGSRCLVPAVIFGVALVGCAGIERDLEPTPVSVRPEPLAEVQSKPSPVAPIHSAAFSQSNEVSSDEPLELLTSPPQVVPVESKASGSTGSQVIRLPEIPAQEAHNPEMLALDLAGALAMTAGQNPRIAFAAAEYREAYAQLQLAKTLWLPSIRAGMSFNHHDGTLQASDGQVIDVSRSSLQSGLGVGAVGAGSPIVPGVIAEFHTSDAVFQPKIAAHAASASNAATDATRNDLLLDSAVTYLELLRTLQELRIAEQTLGNAQRLADLTSSFALAGEGSQADADRARAELARQKNMVARAEEATLVAEARLAELLSIDPMRKIIPLEPTIIPVDFVSAEVPPAELVATALSNRPELAEAQSLVCEAVSRYRRERFAPLLPSVLLGVSQSGYGGGLGSEIDDYDGRFDLDALVYWELRNLGLGERARREQTRSQFDQARALRIGLMDQVAREVIESHAQVHARRRQIETAKTGVQLALDSYERNSIRIREGEGLPIEALQSIQALDAARRDYVRALVEYNEAQFRLQRALGWPLTGE